MNRIILHGFTGKDPEIKTLESGKKLAKLTLATQSYRKDKDGNKITDWHNIIAWEKLAELLEKHVKKGSELIIEGEVTYRTYEDKEGVTKYITEIICSGIEFCGKKDVQKPENNEGVSQKGKITTGSKSDINDLPGVNNESSDLPFN
jgi:single-strand DNA-binding protein